MPITPNYSALEGIWDTQMYLQYEVNHVSLKQHEQITFKGRESYDRRDFHVTFSHDGQGASQNLCTYLQMLKLS